MYVTEFVIIAIVKLDNSCSFWEFALIGGGATVSGLAFDFKYVEYYTSEYYRDIWKFGGESDSPQIKAKPCPAFVAVLQADLSESSPEVLWTFPACNAKSYIHPLGNLFNGVNQSTKKPLRDANASKDNFFDLFLTFGGVFEPHPKEIEMHSYVQLSGMNPLSFIL
jgi:hypothetical protein